MAGHAPKCVVGIDVGGTFTDAVVIDGNDGRLLAAFKLPSTSDDPGLAVIEAVERIAADHVIDGAVVCHGTTVGTNTLIERRGARVALVATRGFADVIELRRQARPRLYDMSVQISAPLVAPADRHEVDERMGPDGAVVAPLSGIDTLIDAIRASGADSVAVALLHSYANESHEVSVVDAIKSALPALFITRSTDVCPEFREYERTSTAVVNSYIGPAVARYVGALDEALTTRGISRLMIVKSNGGLTSPGHAARHPVHLIESGPAANLSATAAYARTVGPRDLIAFDMGGTTAKAGVIRDGEPETANEFYADRLLEGREVGGFAIRSTILELVEIGAGGGSIAAIDEVGILKVGPHSAGAVPGPACYGRGGLLPTVTDAHAVIGTLQPDMFVGTGVDFAREPAVTAIQRHIADPYGWSLARAAYAIIDVAVANMAGMVRLATVQRGLDPRDFAMLAAGGAGPLHAALIAVDIGVPKVIVPPFSGMFSALGATLGTVRHEVVRTLLRPLAQVSSDELEEGFRELEDRALALLAAEQGGVRAPRLERSIDARYLGQLFELSLAVGGGAVSPAEVETLFRARYRQEYGIELSDASVQIVTLRLAGTQSAGTATGGVFAGAMEGHSSASARSFDLLQRDGSTAFVPLLDGLGLMGTTTTGPALVSHQGSTVWIQAGQRISFEPNGGITIEMGIVA